MSDGAKANDPSVAMDSATASLADLLVDPGPAVKSLNDIEAIERLQHLQDNSFKIRTLINTWERQQTAERQLRKTYAWGVFALLVVQIGAMGVAFFLIGLGYMEVPEWVASAFAVGVFSEITAMTFLILKYLFPNQDSSKILDTIEKL